MNYAKISSDGNIIAYPYTSQDFKSDNNNTTPRLPLDEAHIGTVDQLENNTSIVRVEETSIPEITVYQTVEEGIPTINSDGNWVQVWNILEKSAEEIAEINSFEESKISNSRIKRLMESDWTQLPDAPLTDAQKSDYATYRQELRDLTTHANWPNLEEADWPVDPHGMLIVNYAVTA